MYCKKMLSSTNTGLGHFKHFNSHAGSSETECLWSNERKWEKIVWSNQITWSHAEWILELH